MLKANRQTNKKQIDKEPQTEGSKQKQKDIHETEQNNNNNNKNNNSNNRTNGYVQDIKNRIQAM